MINRAALLEKIEALEKALAAQKNGYDYEKTFDAQWQAISREVFEQSLGPVSKDRNKKRLQSKYGWVSVNKDHPYCDCPAGFSQSAYLQEQVVLLGQACVFAEGELLLEKLSGIQVSAKQIERLTHHYGELWQEKQQSQTDALQPKENRLHYAMLDGGMVFTRQEGWKSSQIF